MLSTDTILQNRYLIIRPLGRGGMGAVYEALDQRLSRTVAIKETLVETDDLRSAFEREGRLLANLRHPALPKVLDHFSEGAGLFLVMEFIPDDDLGVMLERGRSFVAPEVLRWSDQLLDALEYLHTLDPPVLHRDIKPSNLKLISPRQIVLLDFGIAKGAAGQMTHTGSKSVLAYSPNYSPLEQIQGAGTDERSDLYSLGATLYHLMTGVKPPDALSRATATVNGLLDPLRPAHEVNNQVQVSTSAALMRAMALNIDNRPRTASEMRDDLHNMSPRAATTIPMVDETTKINLTANRANAITSDATRVRERGHQVVVHLPEETLVARKHGGSGRKWIVAVGLIAGLGTLSALLYFSYYGTGGSRRAQSDRTTTRRSPSSTPTLTVNTNRQDNTQPVADPTELAARAKLTQKNIPFSEGAFASVVEDGDVAGVDLFLAAGMNPNAKDANGRTVLINAASKGSNNISRKLLNGGGRM